MFNICLNFCVLVKEMCKVLFAYDAVNEDELTLREGDMITLVNRDGQDKGWWKGELRGKVGVFPDNFVQIIPSDEVSNQLLLGSVCKSYHSNTLNNF